MANLPAIKGLSIEPRRSIRLAATSHMAVHMTVHLIIWKSYVWQFLWRPYIWLHCDTYGHIAVTACRRASAEMNCELYDEEADSSAMKANNQRIVAVSFGGLSGANRLLFSLNGRRDRRAPITDRYMQAEFDLVFQKIQGVPSFNALRLCLFNTTNRTHLKNRHTQRSCEQSGLEQIGSLPNRLAVPGAREMFLGLCSNCFKCFN